MSITFSHWQLQVLRLLLIAAGLLPWLVWIFEVNPDLFAQIFAPLCHQRPERSLTLASQTMVVCSRCAGVYLGVATGAVITLPKRLLPHARYVLILAGSMMGLDVLTQELGLHDPWNATRLLTGAIGGWSLAALAITALSLEREQRASDVSS